MAKIHASSESGKNIIVIDDDVQPFHPKKRKVNRNGPVVVKNFVPGRRDGFTKDYTVAAYSAEWAKFWKQKGKG